MKFQGCFLQILAFIAFLCRAGGSRKARGGNFALPLDFDRIRSKTLYVLLFAPSDFQNFLRLCNVKVDISIMAKKHT
jgi:hypothetical protein